MSKHMYGYMVLELHKNTHTDTCIYMSYVLLVSSLLFSFLSYLPIYLLTSFY